MIDEAAIDRYAQLIHERGRLTVNAERDRPFVIPAWGDRTEEQQELDRRAASAVAAAAVHDAGLDLAAKEMRIRQLEAEAGRLRDALRRHTHTITDRKGTVCGGCLCPAPCPDAALAEPQP